MASSSQPAVEHPTPSLALKRFIKKKAQGSTEDSYFDDRVFIPNLKEKVASDTRTLVYYLCFFSGLASDRELPSPFLAPIGPSWVFDILIDKQGKSSRALQAWGNILTGREIFISSSNPSKSVAHAEVYCPTQFARQLGLVQGIPIPYCGSANIFMSECSSISIEHFRTWFTQSRDLLRRTIAQDLQEPTVPTTPEFDYWWHTKCSFLLGCPPFKRFLEHIEFEKSEFGHKNHDDSSSFSSDGGFGVAGGIEDILEGEVDQQVVPIEASPMSMIIPSPPPRRQSSRVPQKRGIASPPPTTSKRSKTISQPKKIIPTKHYLESSSQPPGLFLLNNCLSSLCLLVHRNHALYLSCFAAPKRAKATRQLKLTPSSSDEETETNTGALVSRGKAKETSKALVYERKEKAVRKSKTLDELTFPDQLQGLSSNLPIIPHQEASGTMPARETCTHQDSAKVSLDITTLLLSLAESIPPTPFQVRMDFSVLSYINGYIKPNTCIGFPQVFPISVESPVHKSILDNQLMAAEPLGVRRRDPFPYPLQVSEQDSSPRSSTSALPISLVKSFDKQDSDTPTSSKDQVVFKSKHSLKCLYCLFYLSLLLIVLQVDNTAIDMEVIPSLELSSSLPPPDEPSSPSIDLPIVAFDVSFYRYQLGLFCDSIADPISPISSNSLESLKQLLNSSTLPSSPYFRIKHVPTGDDVLMLKHHLKALHCLGLPALLEHGLIYHFEVCYRALLLSNELPSSISSTLQENFNQFGELVARNQFLSEGFRETALKVEKMEATASKIATQLSLH
ncbi:hypothetical protein RHMOL_Rhmol02G0162500 [Rhododendron molle]|uniref:Uncharacterized protein n=1 Tax=Rhododendron molle TaxID=49168 RepID=A0ACC0PQF3_RHOML|nr:hypothetical protein RHMOL_Rhmol02G0162500 [Rhododendron molle]